MTTPTLTPAQLTYMAAVAAASNGLATETGPDQTTFQMMAVVEDLALCTARNDTVRYNYLLLQSQNAWGDGSLNQYQVGIF